MVLYRKYRPKFFSEMIGQKPIITVLTNEIKTNKIAHAYLLTGPRGLGKTTTARIFAKAVNCKKRKKGQAEPCNQCQSCQEINQGRNLDLIEMDAASQTGVDNVRENIIAYSRIPPTHSKYKIFIIDEVHMLSLSAFNALLKILEEPPSYVIFILATTEINKVPETIISRCQRFDFRKVSPDKMVQLLEKISKNEKVDVDKKILKMIAQKSQGCVRDSESLLGQVLSLNDKKITFQEASLIFPPNQTKQIEKFIEFIFKKDDKRAIELINELLNNGLDLEQFRDDTIEFLRKILFFKTGIITDNFYWQMDELTKSDLEKLASLVDIKKLVSIIEELVKTKIYLSYTDIPQLPLELAVLKITNGK